MRHDTDALTRSTAEDAPALSAKEIARRTQNAQAALVRLVNSEFGFHLEWRVLETTTCENMVKHYGLKPEKICALLERELETTLSDDERKGIFGKAYTGDRDRPHPEYQGGLLSLDSLANLLQERENAKKEPPKPGSGVLDPRARTH